MVKNLRGVLSEKRLGSASVVHHYCVCTLPCFGVIFVFWDYLLLRPKKMSAKDGSDKKKRMMSS